MTDSDEKTLRTAKADPAYLENADPDRLDCDKLTPMLQHYLAIKAQNPHALLLYRVGDFFECFFLDALTVARALELVCTSKEGGKTIGRVPMAGIPHHALDRYSIQLVEKGFAVAICDQVEDAAAAKAENRMVERQVTKLLTPGTLTEDTMLVARRNNFLAAVVLAGPHWGLAYADISTGEFATTTGKEMEALTMELLRLQPAEILFPVDAPEVGKLLRPGEAGECLPAGLPEKFCYALRSQVPFTTSEARQRLLLYYDIRSLEGMGCEDSPLCVRAAGGLLEYIETTQKANPVRLQNLKTYALADYLILDHQTRRNLEILQTSRDGTYHGSLLWAIDRTRTAMGARSLRRWLLQPLIELRGIRARQETIAELIEDGTLRQDLQELLKQIYDIERLIGRSAAGTANGRELVALGESLVRLNDLAELANHGNSPYLRAVRTVPPDLEKLGRKILAILVDSPPPVLTEGGLIRPKIDPNLDAMRAQIEGDRQWLAALEETERERTGIPKLKVGYNKAFGYFISMPRSQASKAPDDYTRKQTLDQRGALRHHRT